MPNEHHDLSAEDCNDKFTSRYDQNVAAFEIAKRKLDNASNIASRLLYKVVVGYTRLVANSAYTRAEAELDAQQGETPPIEPPVRS